MITRTIKKHTIDCTIANAEKETFRHQEVEVVGYKDDKSKDRKKIENALKLKGYDNLLVWKVIKEEEVFTWQDDDEWLTNCHYGKPEKPEKSEK